MDIEQRIYLLRGQRVMLDRDLAEAYDVETRYLNQAVSRNLERFPEDFMFQLSPTEHQSLRCQIGTLKRGQHPKYLPRVFTEQGVAMLSSVLRSKSAVQVNILIMRAFVKLRRALAASPSLAARMRQVEERLGGHDAALGDHAQMIRAVFDDIRRLMEPAPARKKGAAGSSRGHAAQLRLMGNELLDRFRQGPYTGGMQYTVVIRKNKYGYDVSCPALPGCHSQGETKSEALENIKDAITVYLDMVKKETRGETRVKVTVPA